MKKRKYTTLLMCGVLFFVLMCVASCGVVDDDPIEVKSTTWPNTNGNITEGGTIPANLYRSQDIRGEGVALAFPEIGLSNAVHNLCAYLIYRNISGVLAVDFAAYDFDCSTGFIIRNISSKDSFGRNTKFLNTINGTQTWEGFSNPDPSININVEVFNYGDKVADTNPEINETSELDDLLTVLNEKTSTEQGAADIFLRRFSRTLLLEAK